MTFSHIFYTNRRRNFLISSYIIGVILFFTAWKHFYNQPYGNSSEILKDNRSKIYLCNDETQRNCLQDMNSSLRQKAHLVKDKIQEKQKELPQYMVSPPISSILNIYNISKNDVLNKTMCVKTNTSEQYFICTYPVKEDKFVSGSIQKHGFWESAITKHISDVLKHDKNQPVTFIDVGANIGYYSLLAAAIGQNAIAIEPWHRHIQKLTTSIQLNKFQGRIKVVQNAVSNERRDVKLNEDVHGNLGAARLILGREIDNYNQTTTVRSILLNDVVSLIHTRNVVLKLDIEGHECKVFETADSLFDNFTVILIVMEWGIMKIRKNKPGVACQEKNIQEMVDMLTRRGYVPYSNNNIRRLDPKDNKNWNEFDIHWRPSNRLE